MKKAMIAAAIGLCMTGGHALAQTAGDSPWLLRVRATQLDMANKDRTDLGLSVNDKTIPEVDISYFFSPNVAAELVLTVPQRQRVSSTAVGGDIGTFKHLPPTLLLQYHFTGLQGFKPYVGAGVNYTRISSVKLDATASLDKESWGTALQVGVDVPLSKNWSLNVDLKKVQIRTDVYTGGTTNHGELRLDPTLASVGLGYRF